MQQQYIASFLREHGIRPSLSRIKVYEYLREYENHPTADQLYQDLLTSMPGLSKTTIYNTLKLFLERGIVSSLIIDENEKRFDAETDFHAHFRCISCGMIQDVYLLAKEVAWVGLDNYDISEQQLYLKGYCPRCKKP